MIDLKLLKIYLGFLFVIIFLIFIYFKFSKSKNYNEKMCEEEKMSTFHGRVILAFRDMKDKGTYSLVLTNGGNRYFLRRCEEFPYNTYSLAKDDSIYKKPGKFEYLVFPNNLDTVVVLSRNDIVCN